MYYVFVDLEKAYDRLLRKELEEQWYCMRQSGMVEKHVGLMQDTYGRTRKW